MSQLDDSNFLMQSAIKAGHSLDESAMAFLYSTGKVELVLRNLLAAELVKTLKLNRDEQIEREWKRHDLVLLKGKKATHIIEGKAWLHADVTHPTKLDQGGAEIKVAFEKDLLKIRNTQLEHPEAIGYITIILSSIDVSNCGKQLAKLISYPSLHKRGIKDAGSFENLHSTARSLLTEFLNNRSEVLGIKRERLFTGKYAGMEVWVDFFVAEIGRREI
jgi:hypothetical protein